MSEEGLSPLQHSYWSSYTIVRLGPNSNHFQINYHSYHYRYNATLTLEAGVTLNFEKNRGIYVDGKLDCLNKNDTTLYSF